MLVKARLPGMAETMRPRGPYRALNISVAAASNWRLGKHG